MKLYTVSGQAIPEGAAAEEYRAARAIGGVRAGAEHLFFRAGLRTYAVAWPEVTRCYRRVMRVPMKMCCGSGSLDVESLVVEGPSGELATIQLPGSRAARALMDLLSETAPAVELAAPKKAEGTEARA